MQTPPPPKRVDLQTRCKLLWLLWGAASCAPWAGRAAARCSSAQWSTRGHRRRQPRRRCTAGRGTDCSVPTAVRRPAHVAGACCGRLFGTFPHTSRKCTPAACRLSACWCWCWCQGVATVCASVCVCVCLCCCCCCLLCWEAGRQRALVGPRAVLAAGVDTFNGWWRCPRTTVIYVQQRASVTCTDAWKTVFPSARCLPAQHATHRRLSQCFLRVEGRFPPTCHHALAQGQGRQSHLAACRLHGPVQRKYARTRGGHPYIIMPNAPLHEADPNRLAIGCTWSEVLPRGMSA